VVEAAKKLLTTVNLSNVIQLYIIFIFVTTAYILADAKLNYKLLRIR